MAKTLVYICDCRTFEVTEKVSDDTIIPEEVPCGCGKKLKRRRNLEDFPNQIKFVR